MTRCRLDGASGHSRRRTKWAAGHRDSRPSVPCSPAPHSPHAPHTPHGGKRTAAPTAAAPELVPVQFTVGRLPCLPAALRLGGCEHGQRRAVEVAEAVAAPSAPLCTGRGSAPHERGRAAAHSAAVKQRGACLPQTNLSPCDLRAVRRSMGCLNISVRCAQNPPPCLFFANLAVEHYSFHVFSQVSLSSSAANNSETNKQVRSRLSRICDFKI